jgi:P27 family predicted phage terminase small subunit
MKRGRRRDAPAVKKAKAGHFRKPEKRDRSKATKLSADERAQMLAGLQEGEVPAFLLNGADFRLEIQIWKDLAPDLKRINALAKLDRFGFAMYCVHMADWVTATLHIKKNGATYKSRNTINKDVLHKLSPMVRVREIAERHILELGARFGLDPTNRFKLVAAQAGLAGQGMLPFGDSGAGKPPSPATAPEAERPEVPTAFLSRNSSEPPQRPN